MSAYDPETAVEAAYCGAKVYADWRADNGLVSAGTIHGFIWDTSDNGVIVSFTEPIFFIRYFIPWDQLEECWSKEKGFELGTDIQFVEAVPNRELIVCETVKSRTWIRRNKKRIPVWSYLI